MNNSSNKKEIHVICTEQRPILPDQIGLKLQVSLVEQVDGGPEIIPNIMFEVRVGVDKVYNQQSNSQGILELNDVRIPYQDNPNIDVEVKAFDDSGEISTAIQLSIEEGLKNLREAGENMRIQKSRILELSKQIQEAKKEEEKRAVVSELVAMKNNPLAVDALFEMDDEAVIWCVDIFKDEDFAEILALKLANSSPALLLDNFPLFYEKTWAKKIVLYIAENEPDIFLDKLPQYEYQPWLKGIFIELTEKNPDILVTKYNKYKHIPFGEEILFLAIQKASPDVTLQNIGSNDCMKQGWAPELLKKSVFGANLEIAIKSLPLFENEGWVEDAFLDIAKKFPDSMADNFPKVASCKWALNVLHSIITRLQAEKIIGLFKFFRDENWAKDVIDQLSESNPEIVAKNKEMFTDHVELNNRKVLEIIEKLEEQAIKELLTNLNRHSKDKDIEEKLMKIAETMPEEIFTRAGEINRLLAGKSDEIIGIAVNKLIDSGNEKIIVMQLGVNRSNFIDYLNYIESNRKNVLNYSWIGKILFLMAKHFPNQMMWPRFKIYESTGWATEILNILEGHDPMKVLEKCKSMNPLGYITRAQTCAITDPSIIAKNIKDFSEEASEVIGKGKRNLRLELLKILAEHSPQALITNVPPDIIRAGKYMTILIPAIQRCDSQTIIKRPSIYYQFSGMFIEAVKRDMEFAIKYYFVEGNDDKEAKEFPEVYEGVLVIASKWHKYMMKTYEEAFVRKFGDKSTVKAILRKNFIFFHLPASDMSNII